jgi:hypothetical protein
MPARRQLWWDGAVGSGGAAGRGAWSSAAGLGSSGELRRWRVATPALPGGGATEECSLAVDSDAASLLAGAMARELSA